MPASLRIAIAAALLSPLPAAAAAETAQPRAICAAQEWRTAFAVPGLTCIATVHGLVIAPADEAEMLRTVIDEAAARFERHFGTPRGSIALVAGGSMTREQVTFLRERGHRAMPWISAEQRNTLMGPRIREQLSKQRPDLTGPALDAAVASALGAIPKQGAGLERGALAHELNHIWFHMTFESAGGVSEQPAKPGEIRYGSAAPDWIDEMAAVLGENDEIAATRRAGLARLVSGTGEEGLYPLADYLSMSHPVMTMPNREAVLGKPAAPSGGAGVRIVARSDGGPAARPSPLLRFYIQSRAFADFLLDRTGDERVFLAIAKALAGGESFDQWLARDGKAHKLPATTAALSTQWEAWVRSR